MKIEMQYSDPETVPDRQPYRIRIEGKDGQAFEIVEQTDGGFCVFAASGRQLSIHLIPPMVSGVVIKSTDPRKKS